MMHFAVFYGDGKSTSNIFGQHYFTGMLSRYGSDTVHFVDCFHDSLTNRAKANTGGGAILTADYSLNSTNQWDTLNGGLLPIQIQLPSGGLTVPAGHNFVGMTMSYESGDAGFTPLDTVLITDASGMNGHYKYNMFRPLLAVYGTSTSPLFPPYNDWHTNGNTGLFKYQPDGGWFGYYVPMWAWSTNNGTAASDYQFPYVSFHIVCTSCGLVDVPGVSQIISSVKAYPNPATDEVAISFNLSNASDLTVTLTNAIGQLVSAQHMGNMSNGKAIFNTSNVAAGIYFYTVEANGQREVGRITVAH